MTHKQATIILFVVSIAWGSSYIFMKMMDSYDSLYSIIIFRFGIAFILIFLVFFKKMLSVDLKTLGYSAISGTLIFATYLALMYGIKTTSASTAGFLASTSVIFVPLFIAIKTRRLPAKKIIIGVVFVMTGMLFLSLGDGLVLTTGSIFCIVTAIVYACHILLTNVFIRKVDAFLLGAYQLAYTSIYGVIFSFFTNTFFVPNKFIEWVPILGLAIFCSAFAFVMQTIAQQYTSPESTAFLFALEPIFATIFAIIFLKEMFTALEFFGAALILVGVGIVNLQPRKPNINYVET